MSAFPQGDHVTVKERCFDTLVCKY